MSMFGSGNSSFGRFIEISKVNVAPYLSILFLDKYYVWQPLSVLNRSNEASYKEFLHFLDNLSFNIWMKGSHGLYYRFHNWFDIKSMPHKLGSKPGISSYSQEKTSAYSFKSAMSWVFSSCDRFALIEVVHGTLRLSLRSTISSSISTGKDRSGVGNNSSHGSAMLSEECSAGAVVSWVQQQVGVVLASFSPRLFCLRQLGPTYCHNR